MSKKKSTTALISELKRKTRRKYSSEEKIRIILEGFRGETTIAELCRREGISQAVYYKWSKDFMEAGKRRLTGDTIREANTSEVQELKKENSILKEVVAELTLKHRELKKKWNGENS
jgi:transposase